MKSTQTAINMKTCSLCNKSSADEGISLVYFGEWMVKKEITVHYYCLLLSTNLSQRGEDHSGILGFLLRDIRHEIALAKKRKCKYCFEMSASICCCKCKEYFHLTCGHTSKCLSEFVGEFKSYCHSCIPEDNFLKELFARKPPQCLEERCFICAEIIGTNPRTWIYAKCCGNGFTHAKCMKMYALNAGYYLTCIWCKNKQFREDIKYQGIFVPDREANWEKKGAYGELYGGHRRCDMEICNCPKGRNYINAGRWQLINCKFCGAFGSHNPACIPGLEGTKEPIQEFKCDVCSVTERTVIHHKSSPQPEQDLINMTLYVSKDAGAMENELPAAVQLTRSLSINSSSDDSLVSQDTVIRVDLAKCQTLPAVLDNNDCIASGIYTLTQSPPVSQHQQLEKESNGSIIPSKEFPETTDLVQQQEVAVSNCSILPSKELPATTELVQQQQMEEVSNCSILPSKEPPATTAVFQEQQEVAATAVAEVLDNLEDISDDDANLIADLLVQKFLDVVDAIFE